jgi:hypothetical protein
MGQHFQLKRLPFRQQVMNFDSPPRMKTIWRISISQMFALRVHCENHARQPKRLPPLLRKEGSLCAIQSKRGCLKSLILKVPEGDKY